LKEEPVAKPAQRLDLQFPARIYPEARKFKREVHLHIGPTNSGKSYTALSAFKAAKSGYYAGPLRMLAREVFDRVNSEGIACNLITGDEILESPGASHNSSTIEMMNLNVDMEVAVIDEIQMIGDPDRGSTWTQALLGVRAKVLHLCGDPNSEDIVQKLMAETGDTLTVHRYERLNKLEVENKALAGKKKTGFYNSLRPGDCVVAFSKNDVQRIRDNIVSAKGRKGCCAVIYGSLPPDIRAEQSRQFNDPDSGVDYLVASDAIGMGLNLAIKRVVFTTISKFDGNVNRELEIGEIKQIAGRAGRFRTQTGEEGESGKVTSVQKDSIPAIKRAMKVSTPKLEEALVKSSKHSMKLTSYSENIAFSTLVMDWYRNVETGRNYRMSRVAKIIDYAKLTDKIRDLTFSERVMLLDAPISNDPTQEAAFVKICRTIAASRVVNVVTLFPDIIESLSHTNTSTQVLEKVHRIISLYLWFSYRFPCNFTDRATAVDLKRLCEAQFNALLGSRRALASKRR